MQLILNWFIAMHFAMEKSWKFHEANLLRDHFFCCGDSMTSFLSSSLKLALKSVAPSVFAFIRKNISAADEFAVVK